MNMSKNMSINSGYKKDLRITRTRKLLSQALFSLLGKESFEKITVKDICDVAMVSRSSFYSHFEDKYHLLFYCLEEIKQELNKKIDYSQKEFLIERVLEYILANRKLFKTLFATETSLELRQMLDTLFTEEIEEFLRKKSEATLEPVKASVGMISIFIAGGISHLIQWWVRSDYQATVPEMVTFISKSFDYEE